MNNNNLNHNHNKRQKFKGIIIREGERVDDLHRNGLYIIQDPKRFCFGVDAVFLSSFCNIKPNENVIDLGTGTGILPILLAGKTKGRHFTGLEIQEESVEMARRSVLINNLDQRIKIDFGDITKIKELYNHASFQVVCSNPPYIAKSNGIINSYSPKAIARHEIYCTLNDVVQSASWLLQFGGRFYMVHRPDRLTDILLSMRKNKLEPKILRFVHTFIEKPPILILVEAMRGGNPSMNVLPPLIVYDKTGMYTEETRSIYYN